MKLCTKRLYKAKYFKYLGIKNHKNFNLKIDIHDHAPKLNRANAVLVKLRPFVNSKIIRCTYFIIFHSHLNYACIASGLTRSSHYKKSILQKKALRILNFASFNAHTTLLFKNCTILKFIGIINVENYISTIYSYNTRSTRDDLLFLPCCNSVRF